MLVHVNHCYLKFAILRLPSDDVGRWNEKRLYHYRGSNSSAHVDNLLHHTDMRTLKAYIFNGRNSIQLIEVQSARLSVSSLLGRISHAKKIPAKRHAWHFHHTHNHEESGHCDTVLLTVENASVGKVGTPLHSF